MNVASLGLRSGSFGSLQQQVHNYGALSSQKLPLLARKPSRMPLSVSREKEKFLLPICKGFGRRKFWMLLLFVVSVAVLLSISILSREEYTLESQDIPRGGHVWSIVTSDKPSFSAPLKNNEVNPTPEQHPAVNTQNPTIMPPPVLSFTRHPCQSFNLSPSVADKRHTGPRPCPVCYSPIGLAVALRPSSPSASPVLKNLSYLSEVDFADDLNEGSMFGGHPSLLRRNESSDDLNEGSIFGGHPSLLQRNESFDVREMMSVRCGFVKGKIPGQGTGFDIDGTDLLEMEECHDVVVASAIFGNYDIMQQPKNISEYSKQNACFYMFVDEETEAHIKNSTSLDNIKQVGLWRVVVVRNLPFIDPRRNGKVPKLLLHRLFPNVRFSIWIDGKLELVIDPYQILERFLWRANSTFAISRHYRRFDVFDEAEANKAAGKYDNSSIDSQIEFYEKEGLTHYSSAKLPITSDVPEGCVIIREHIPITNLFSCLWFNEVDRFTSRDQLSFSTVRDKMMSRVNWTINMFMDCERRNFVVQAYHKDLLEQRKALAALRNQQAAMITTSKHGVDRLARASPSRKLPAKIPTRRGKDRKSNSRRHHSKTAIGRADNLE